jgi:hypothetical protein
VNTSFQDLASAVRAAINLEGYRDASPQEIDEAARSLRNAWLGFLSLPEVSEAFGVLAAEAMKATVDDEATCANCGMARSRFPDVPETHEIAKVLGYCKALVAHEKAIQEWRDYNVANRHRDPAEYTEDDAYLTLMEERGRTGHATVEALSKIGDLVPTVITDLQGQRDALKEAIVVFLVKAAPEMPESLAGAVGDLMKAVW